jgi:hypothetical protein
LLTLVAFVTAVFCVPEPVAEEVDGLAGGEVLLFESKTEAEQPASPHARQLARSSKRILRKDRISVRIPTGSYQAETSLLCKGR